MPMTRDELDFARRYPNLTAFGWASTEWPLRRIQELGDAEKYELWDQLAANDSLALRRWLAFQSHITAIQILVGLGHFAEFVADTWRAVGGALGLSSHSRQGYNRSRRFVKRAPGR